MSDPNLPSSIASPMAAPEAPPTAPPMAQGGRRAGRRGLCLVLVAPSGAGKTSVSRALLAEEAELSLSVSATTRAPRPGETEGVHYHFRSPDAFEAMERALGEARAAGGTTANAAPSIISIGRGRATPALASAVIQANSDRSAA